MTYAHGPKSKPIRNACNNSSELTLEGLNSTPCEPRPWCLAFTAKGEQKVFNALRETVRMPALTIDTNLTRSCAQSTDRKSNGKG